MKFRYWLNSSHRACSVLAAVLCVPSAFSAQQAAPDNHASEFAQEFAAARQLVAQAEAQHPGNSHELADALREFARLANFGYQSDDGTLPQIERAEAVNASVYGATSAEHLRALIELSRSYYLRARFADARSRAEQAVELAQALPAAKDGLPDAWQVLGVACNRQGDYASAIKALDHAMLLLRDGTQNKSLAEALSDRAYARFNTGDTPGARADLLEAAAIHEKVLTPDDPLLGTTFHNLGSFLVRSGDPKQAIPYLERALAIKEKNFGAENYLVQSTKATLSLAYARTSQFQRAWELEASCLAAYDKLFGHSHPYTAFVIEQYSVELAAGGNYDLAMQQALDAERVSRDYFVLAAQTLPERQALAYASDRAHGVDIALSLVAKGNAGTLDGVYQEVIGSRALVANEMAGRKSDITSARDPETSRLAAQLAARRDALMKLLRQPAGQTPLADQINEARSQMEEAESELAEHSAAFRRKVAASGITLAQIRAALPDDARLISYVRYRSFPVSPDDPNAKPADSYLALVVNARGAIHCYPLGAAEPIERQVRAVRAAIETEASSAALSSLRNEHLYREAAGRLRELVWDPLKLEVRGTHTVFIVPDGLLNLVPFAALPFGTSSYLVDRPQAIHYLSSERDLVPGSAASTNHGMMAIGAPLFAVDEKGAEVAATRGAGSSCSDWRKMRFAPLPASRQEIDNVGDIWKRTGGEKPFLLDAGADATRDAFLRDAGGKRILHIATHAYFIPQDCGDANPLLRAGLAFSGANLTDAGVSPGIVTAQDIAAMDLSGVSWAVLSACSTGDGEVRNGEGVLGLQRSFRLAGVETVVMSLWAVDDRSTRDFMRLLYQMRLQDHASTADAMRGAMREQLHALRAANKSTHPFFWAAFIASGDWR